MLKSLCLTLLLCASAASAQTLGQWFFGDSEFHRNAAWVSGRSMQGGIDTLTIECGAQGAVYEFMPMRALPDDRTGEVFFNFPGQTLRYPATFNASAAEPAWTGPLTAELASRLSRHSSMTVGAPMNGLTEFRLRGSRAAISKVLAICGPGRLAPVQAELTRDFIFQKIALACQGDYVPDPGAVIESDLDGDGKFDYVINWSMINCTAPAYSGMRRGAGFCGAAMCTSDVYASSTFNPAGFAQGILNIGLEAWPEGSAYPLRTNSINNSCPNSHCVINWQWTGAEFQAIR